MIYILMGYLPWSTNSGHISQDIDGEEISPLPDVRNMKKRVSHWMLENNLPTECITYIEYCRNLEFEEKPDYNYLRTLLLNLFKHKRFSVDNHFEWNSEPIH